MIWVYYKAFNNDSRKRQKEAILAYLTQNGIDVSMCTTKRDTPYKTTHFDEMLKEACEGDVVICEKPCFFGVGMAQSIDNLRRLLTKGVRVYAVYYGKYVDESYVEALSMAQEVLRDCIEMDIHIEKQRDRGLREENGGYFDDMGVWREGCRKVYKPKVWMYDKVGKHTEQAMVRRQQPESLWIEMKICEGWTTNRIWKEYQDLRKVLPRDLWGNVSKSWINTRRLELIK